MLYPVFLASGSHYITYYTHGGRIGGRHAQVVNREAVDNTIRSSVWQAAQSERHLQVGTELIKAGAILNDRPYVLQLSLSRRYLTTKWGLRPRVSFLNVLRVIPSDIICRPGPLIFVIAVSRLSDSVFIKVGLTYEYKKDNYEG